MESFDSQLRSLLNQFSQENNSDTPDYILANYLQDCLNAYNRAVQLREKWHGREVRNPQELYDE